MAAWAIGAELLFSDRISRLFAVAAFAEFLAYAFVVLLLTASFRIAVFNYLPAALFLLIAFTAVYRREKNRSFLVAACGLVLTFAAALFQQFELGIHPVYFNHNAVDGAAEKRRGADGGEKEDEPPPQPHMPGFIPIKDNGEDQAFDCERVVGKSNIGFSHRSNARRIRALRARVCRPP